MSDEEVPLIARIINLSSVRVTVPVEIIRANGYKAGDKVAVRISDENGEAVEFSAYIRKFGVQYMFTIPAHVWPYVCNMGYGVGDAIPMSIERAPL